MKPQTSILYRAKTYHTCVLLWIRAKRCIQAVVSSRGGLHRRWREECVRARAGRARVTVQTVGVAGTSTFSAVTVDGSLQLPWRTQSLLLTLKRVQVLHIPTKSDSNWSHFLVQLSTTLKLLWQDGPRLTDWDCSGSNLSMERQQTLLCCLFYSKWDHHYKSLVHFLLRSSIIISCRRLYILQQKDSWLLLQPGAIITYWFNNGQLIWRLSVSYVYCHDTYWVRRVKAALVMDVGRLRPLVMSLQIFLLITSTRPPFSVTSLYSLYRSSTCFAMMGMRFTGVPE